MPMIQYLGPSHFRELGAADFKKLGVEGQKKLTFSRDEPLKVSGHVADALTQNLPDEFAEVDEEDEPAQDVPMTDSANQDEVDHPDGHLPEDEPAR